MSCIFEITRFKPQFPLSIEIYFIIVTHGIWCKVQYATKRDVFVLHVSPGFQVESGLNFEDAMVHTYVPALGFRVQFGLKFDTTMTCFDFISSLCKRIESINLFQGVVFFAPLSCCTKVYNPRPTTKAP